MKKTALKYHLIKGENKIKLCKRHFHCKENSKNIHRKRIARGQSQFPHSCVCERFIWWQDATLFVYFSYFNIHSSIHSTTYNTLIHRHSLRPLSISLSIVCSVGKTSLWCRAKNRTRTCLTASRRRTRVGLLILLQENMWTDSGNI
jgi:hypothetical protein